MHYYISHPPILLLWKFCDAAVCVCVCVCVYMCVCMCVYDSLNFLPAAMCLLLHIYIPTRIIIIILNLVV